MPAKLLRAPVLCAFHARSRTGVNRHQELTFLRLRRAGVSHSHPPQPCPNSKTNSHSPSLHPSGFSPADSWSRARVRDLACLGPTLILRHWCTSSITLSHLINSLTGTLVLFASGIWSLLLSSYHSPPVWLHTPGPRAAAKAGTATLSSWFSCNSLRPG